MSQVRAVKLTESINICYINDMVTCTVKVNIKETFMGKDVKCLRSEWTAVRE